MSNQDQGGLTNGDHWLIRGLGGVNIITLIVLILGGAKLYFELDKDIAFLKRDVADIERDMGDMARSLASIRSDLRQARLPAYAWPPPTTRSATPQNP